jgi:acetolactate synthase-1/2/3 large subunit
VAGFFFAQKIWRQIDMKEKKLRNQIKWSGAKILIEFLLKNDVDIIFGYPGGAVIKIFDELCHYRDKIKIITPRHEQGGTHAADAYAQVSGKPGIVIVTSGPGATNTITGIASAYLDSVPLIIITGQVPSSMVGSDAFQEVDISGITTPITKANFMVTDINDLEEILHIAFNISTTGRPGPVLIDIPSDIQKKEIPLRNITVGNKNGVIHKLSNSNLSIEDIRIFKDFLKKSKKPLVICGGGVNISGSMEILNQFLYKNRIPVVHTLRGIGVDPIDEDLYYGLIGMHGTLYGNYAAQQADLIIALGVRFSDRTVCNKNEFAKKAKIIHVDIDKSEINKNIKIDYPIICDLKTFLPAIIKEEIPLISTKEWLDELRSIKAANPQIYERNGNLKPQYLIELASKYFGPESIIVVDVGQNQMWAAQYYRLRKQRSFICSAGLGTMGYALPAAVGAKIASPKREVLVITGDGGFQMNIQELMTIKKYNLNIKILLLDNNSLGMVRQWQELFYGGRYVATLLDDNPKFYKISKAIGIPSIYLDKEEKAEEAIKLLKESETYMLLHAAVEKFENVMPIVPPGESLTKAILNKNKISKEIS